MQTVNFIAVNDFCRRWNIEVSFIDSLRENGLIEVVNIKETSYIALSQLRQLEKMVSFHYELNINLEGIETIEHLLQLLVTLLWVP